MTIARVRLQQMQFLACHDPRFYSSLRKRISRHSGTPFSIQGQWGSMTTGVHPKRDKARRFPSRGDADVRLRARTCRSQQIDHDGQISGSNNRAWLAGWRKTLTNRGDRMTDPPKNVPFLSMIVDIQEFERDSP